MYLSSPRVNIAEESVVDHRVQLQCKFDEMEGKYTEAKPRCTCPSYESNLHQVGEVQHLLPLDLMLVHFRPHLCSGYTDQYHSFLQKVKSSMITEQNGILIHHGIFVFHIIYFYCKDNTVTSTYYDKQKCLCIISGSKLRSRIGVFWPRELFSKS